MFIDIYFNSGCRCEHYNGIKRILCFNKPKKDDSMNVITLLEEHSADYCDIT